VVLGGIDTQEMPFAIVESIAVVSLEGKPLVDEASEVYIDALLASTLHASNSMQSKEG